MKKFSGKIKDDSYNFLVGFFMGSANVIPGVSGGTMLFIMGAFGKLIDTLKTIGSIETLKLLCKGDFKALYARIEWRFLFFLILGTLAWAIGDIYIDPILRHLDKFCWKEPREACEIVCSELKREIGSYAGIAAAMNYLKENGKLEL